MTTLGLGIGGFRGSSGATIASYLARATRNATFTPAIGTKYQTNADATPVTTAGQAVGRWRAAAGYAADMLFDQAAAGARPAWNTDRVTFDGTADYMDGSAAQLPFTNGQTQIMFAMRARLTSISGTPHLLNVATGTGATTARLALRINPTGSPRIDYRRLDADSNTNTSSSAPGPVTANTWFKVMWAMDLVNNIASGFVDNGPDLIAFAMTGSGGFSATDSLRMRFMANLTNTAALFSAGDVSSIIMGNKYPTPAERTAIFGALT